MVLGIRYCVLDVLAENGSLSESRSVLQFSPFHQLAQNTEHSIRC